LILAQSIDTDSADAMILALKRWVGQSSLTNPQTSSPSDFLTQYWLIALAAIFVFGLLAQGPRRFLVGLFQRSEFEAILKSGLVRLRSRLLVPLAMFGLLLTSWSTSQLLQYRSTANFDALQLTLRGKTVTAYSLEQGVMTAITPLRDLISLADAWPLVAAGLFCGFRYASMAQWIPNSIKTRLQFRAQFYNQIFWIVSSIWLVYRLVVGVSGDGGLPLYSGAWFEIVLEPITMVLIDATLLAWVIVEIRDSLTSDTERLAPNFESIFELFPSIVLVSILLAPARIFSHLVWLTWNTALENIDGSQMPVQIVQKVIWALSWGLIDLQTMAAPLAILAGAVAFGRGSVRQTLGVLWRTLRAKGSLYFQITVAMGVLGFFTTSSTTMLMLAHPAEPWVLMAADFYSHMLSLGVGLWYLSCLIELCSTFVKSETELTTEKSMYSDKARFAIETEADQLEPVSDSNASS
jgi:hypothetical protein